MTKVTFFSVSVAEGGPEDMDEVRWFEKQPIHPTGSMVRVFLAAEATLRLFSITQSHTERLTLSMFRKLLFLGSTRITLTAYHYSNINRIGQT